MSAAAAGSRTSSTSIKTVLFAALGLLGVLFVAAVIWKGKSTLANYTSAVGQQEFDQGRQPVHQGAVRSSDGAAGDQQRAAGCGSRAGHRPCRDREAPQCGQSRFRRRSGNSGAARLPEQIDPDAGTQAALGKANDFRKRADAALKLPRDQRDETLRKTYIPVITDSVNAALKVWFSALYTTAKNDPQLAMLATIKEIGFQMRDWAGKERSNVASSVAGRHGADPRDDQRQRPIRGRVDMLWELLQHLTYDPAPAPRSRKRCALPRISTSRASAAVPTRCEKSVPMERSIR
jgi:hypothetical protein